LKKNGNIVIGGGAAGDGFEEKVEALGIPFIGLPVDKKGINPRSDVRLFCKLYGWYHRERPDIVHHFTIKPVIYGSMAAHLARVPRIINTITGLGYVFTGEEKPWLKRLVESMYRLSIRRAHFTFFQNKDDLDFFLKRRLVQDSRAGLLPGSGVDCEFFVPPFKVKPSNQEAPTFLMVARLLRDKGVYEYVEAAHLVKHQFPTVRFQLLGGPDERNPNVIPQKDLDRWQSEGVVDWLGEVADVRPAMAEADVVVLPSYYREGIPRALLEGAAMGRPLITTNAVGCREVVDEGINGLLVPIKDVQALAKAMTKMIKNPSMRNEMGRAGRLKIEKEFDEQIVIRKVMKAYAAGTVH
jgi:glycosyltransferase involved in cell wall biosynthesis